VSDEEEFRHLKGDDLTWALHRENRSRMKLLREKMDWTTDLLYAILALVGASFIGVHIFDSITLFGHP